MNQPTILLEFMLCIIQQPNLCAVQAPGKRRACEPLMRGLHVRTHTLPLAGRCRH
jgi:hypothetical protein